MTAPNMMGQYPLMGQPPMQVMSPPGTVGGPQVLAGPFSHFNLSPYLSTPSQLTVRAWQLIRQSPGPQMAPVGQVIARSYSSSTIDFLPAMRRDVQLSCLLAFSKLQADWGKYNESMGLAAAAVSRTCHELSRHAGLR